MGIKKEKEEISETLNADCFFDIKEEPLFNVDEQNDFTGYFNLMITSGFVTCSGFL